MMRQLQPVQSLSPEITVFVVLQMPIICHHSQDLQELDLQNSLCLEKYDLFLKVPISTKYKSLVQIPSCVTRLNYVRHHKLCFTWKFVDVLKFLFSLIPLTLTSGPLPSILHFLGKHPSRQFWKMVLLNLRKIIIIA